jgi:hypothetical protein
MQSSDIPARFPIPFANNAGGSFVRPIPEESQIGIQEGAASLETGWPPVCFQPVGSGGVPPFGADFNGLMLQVTRWSRWQAAGAPVGYDATFAAAIGGYPYGAVLKAAAGNGLFWVNTVENNASDPDAGGANWDLFGLGDSGVTPGTYFSPTLTVGNDGRILSAASAAFPQRTILLSGSGGYATKAGCKLLRVRMVAAGGNGATLGGAGTNGNPSVFATVTCAGGVGGSPPSGSVGGARGAGGQGGGGSATNLDRQQGSNGGTGGSSSVGGIGGHGGGGGPGKFGGVGAGNQDPSPPNTGGGGCGQDGGSAQGGGGGGGAGENAEFDIQNPSGTYAFVVGAIGAGGLANAGSGKIVIDEYFTTG